MKLRANLLYCFIVSFNFKFIASIIVFNIIRSKVEVDFPDFAYYGRYALIIYYVYKSLHLYSHTYTFYDKQILIKKGIFSRTEQFVDFFRIKDFQKSQKFWMRLLDITNIRVISSQRLSGSILMRGVKNIDIISFLRQDVHEDRRIHRVLEVD